MVSLGWVQIQVCHAPRIRNLIDSLISLGRLFTRSYLTDIDNIVPFENTTPINQNKKVKIKECRAG